MNADVTEGTVPAPEDAETSHAIRAQLDSLWRQKETAFSKL